MSCSVNVARGHDVLTFNGGGFIVPVDVYLSTNYTLAQWVWLDPTYVAPGFGIQCSETTYGTGMHFMVSTSDDFPPTLDDIRVLQFGLGDAGATGVPLTRGQWVYLVVTWQEFELILYVNGTRAFTRFTAPVFNEGTQMYVGQSSPSLGFGQTWKGFMDDVMLLNVSLSGAQVAQMYALMQAPYFARAPTPTSTPAPPPKAVASPKPPTLWEKMTEGGWWLVNGWWRSRPLTPRDERS